MIMSVDQIVYQYAEGKMSSRPAFYAGTEAETIAGI